MAVPIDEGSNQVETSVRVGKKAGTHSQNEIMKCANYRRDLKLTDHLPQTRSTDVANLYNRLINTLIKLNSKTCLWIYLVLSLRARGCLTTASELSFQWRHPTDSVTSTPRQQVSLEWKYETNQNVERLRFTRYENGTSTKVPVGEWTITNGFIPDPFISTILRVKVEPLPNTTVVKVSLTLQDPIYIDYGLYYNCELGFGHPESKNKSIKLIMQIPEWKDSENNVEVVVGQDVIFKWQYTYPFKSAAVITTKQSLDNIDDLVDIGFWYDGSFTAADPFMNRVSFSLTTQDKHATDDTEIITLILMNVRPEDFGCYYICKIVLGDGEQTTNKRILKEVKLVPPSTPSTGESSKSSPCSTTVPVAVVVMTSIMVHFIKLWI